MDLQNEKWMNEWILQICKALLYGHLKKYIKKEFVQIQKGKDYKTTALSKELSHFELFKIDYKLTLRLPMVGNGTSQLKTTW